MSNQPVQTVGSSGDKIKVALAVAVACAGIVGFYLLSGKSTIVRAGALVAGLVIAAGLAWTSAAGRSFVVFASESVREARKVVWPERKETIKITAIVFGFVLLMAAFLWVSDKVLEFVLYDVILGWKK